MTPEEQDLYDAYIAEGVSPAQATIWINEARTAKVGPPWGGAAYGPPSDYPQGTPGSFPGTPATPSGTRTETVLDDPTDPMSGGIMFYYDARGRNFAQQRFTVSPVYKQVAGVATGEIIGYQRKPGSVTKIPITQTLDETIAEKEAALGRRLSTEERTRLSLGYKPEAADTNALETKMAGLAQYEAQFGPLSPDQRQRYLLGFGAPTGGGPAVITPYQQAELNLAQQKFEWDVKQYGLQEALRREQMAQEQGQFGQTFGLQTARFQAEEARATQTAEQRQREYLYGLAKAPGDWPIYQAALRGQAPPGIGSEIYQGVNRQIPLPAGLLPGGTGGYPSGGTNVPDEYGFVPSPGKTLADFPGANPWMTGYGQPPGAPTIAGLQPYEAGPQPPAMAMLNRGEGIRAPFSLPKGFVSVPGLQSQANMSPSELETQLSTFEMQGGYGPDFTDYMRRARTAVGPGMRPGAYSGYGIRG